MTGGSWVRFPAGVMGENYFSIQSPETQFFVVEDVTLVEFIYLVLIYLVFTRMSGDSYCRRLGSLV